ncbi:tetratricopeptide repeat protein [Aliikangiella maris]|uniref:Tetratricopeptide repeat protein n=2 Tax=Aliikangiella maris TaxID=3162458 RepID=A0ABV3MJA4_9GAMM
MYKENYKIQREIFGEINHYTLTTLYNIASEFEKQQQLEQAEAYQIRAYSGYKQLQGIDHINTLKGAVQLINIYINQYKITAAEKIINENKKAILANKAPEDWFDKASYAEVKRFLKLSDKQ